MLADFFESKALIYVILVCLLLSIIAFVRWLYYRSPKRKNKIIHINASSHTTYTTHRDPYTKTSRTTGNTTHYPARDVLGSEMSKYSLRLGLVSLGVAILLAIVGKVYSDRNVLIEIAQTVQSLYNVLIGF